MTRPCSPARSVRRTSVTAAGLHRDPVRIHAVPRRDDVGDPGRSATGSVSASAETPRYRLNMASLWCSRGSSPSRHRPNRGDHGSGQGWPRRARHRGSVAQESTATRGCRMLQRDVRPGHTATPKSRAPSVLTKSLPGANVVRVSIPSAKREVPRCPRTALLAGRAVHPARCADSIACLTVVRLSLPASACSICLVSESRRPSSQRWAAPTFAPDRQGSAGSVHEAPRGRCLMSRQGEACGSARPVARRVSVRGRRTRRLIPTER